MFNNTKNLSLWHNGPQPGAFYDFPGRQASGGQQYNPIVDKTFTAPGAYGSQRTSQPITTGTSVLGIKFNDGVIIAADTLISYGSLARYREVDRVFKINDNIIIGCGGDYADFQFIKKYIDQKITEDYCYDDKITLKPKSLYNWLTRVLYNKRCRFNPLWIDIIVGGMQDGVPFLGHVDMRGRAYEDSAIATGLGKHLAVPLIREHTEKVGGNVLDAPAAVALTKKCMEILFYRDTRTIAQYKQAICTGSVGAVVEGPLNASQSWDISLSTEVNN